MDMIKPILMTPYLKETIWGGNRLLRFYGKEWDKPTLAESWELSDYPGCESYAADGVFEGRSFSELHKKLAPKKPSVLIKFIDSADDLSVQVHPSVETANVLPKNECWYVVDAEEGARIAYGLNEYMTKKRLIASVEDGSISDKLNYVNVKRGDFFFVPAGLIHAIGKGITLVEVQQTSDTTYRLYDYDRRDANGNLRELHVNEAADAFHNFTEDEIRRRRFCQRVTEEERTCMCDNEFFTVYSFKGESFALNYREDECALVFLSRGVIKCDGKMRMTSRGETFYVPPGCKCEVESDYVLLVIF